MFENTFIFLFANVKFGGAVMRNIGVKVNFMSEVQMNYLIIMLEMLIILSICCKRL